MHEYRCWVPAINRPIFVNQALNILANRLAQTSTCNAYHRRIVRFYDVINPFIKIFVAPKNGRLLAKIRRRNIHRLPVMTNHVTTDVRCAPLRSVNHWYASLNALKNHTCPKRSAQFTRITGRCKRCHWCFNFLAHLHHVAI